MHSQPTWQRGTMADEVLFFKTISSFVAPPPHLGNHPETVATGTCCHHCSPLYGTGIPKLSEMGRGLALLRSGCCPSSSPDSLVSALDLSSVEHSCHREASLLQFASALGEEAPKSGNPVSSKEPCTVSPEVLTP